MGVVKPLKVTLTNYPEGDGERVAAKNHPNFPERGERELPFGREIYIEQDDFMEDPPRKFFRLKPGGEVRLRYAYIIRCDEVVKNEDGDVVELLCTYDEKTHSGSPDAQRKVKGTIHWVSAAHGVRAKVRLYDRLFTDAAPGRERDWRQSLNSDSLVECEAILEPSLRDHDSEHPVQFERLGYFVRDASSPGEPVFNRVVTLRDSWAKLEKQALAQVNT
jgi:glutaminyl-tRNA synthetase